MGAEFAAIAGMLHSTEGHARVRGHHGVDEDLAGLDFVNELVLLLLVVGPHAGAEAEDGVVRQMNGRINVRYGEEHGDGSEDFLTVGWGIGRNIGEYSGLIVVPCPGDAFAAGEKA